MKRALAAILLLLLLVPPVAWLVAERRLSAGLDAWIADRTADGWVVRHGPATRSGFPLQAGLVLTDIALARARGPLAGGLGWTAATLELVLRPLSPSTLLLRPDGAQQLRLGMLPPLELESHDARIAVPLAASPDARITATASALRLAGAGTTAAAGTLSLDLTLHSAARRGEAAVRFAATDASVSGLPGALSSLALDGAIEGAVGDPNDASPAVLASAWRDHGGRLVLQDIAARWGGLAATGSATLSLDAALQPRATGTVRLSGYADGLDRLAAAGTIGQGTARATKAVLGLMAQHDDDGSASVELPLRWQDGVLLAGRIPLLRTPPLDWVPVPE